MYIARAHCLPLLGVVAPVPGMPTDYLHFRAVYLCLLTVAADVGRRLVRPIIRLVFELGGNARKSPSFCAFRSLSQRPGGTAGYRMQLQSVGHYECEEGAGRCGVGVPP